MLTYLIKNDNMLREITIDKHIELNISLNMATNEIRLIHQ